MKPFQPARFNAICQELDDKCNSILDAKKQEYSPDEDRLLNFHQIAEFLDRRPSEVVMTYLLKHVQAVTQSVKTNKYDWCYAKPEGEGLKQRLVDIMNYTRFLFATLEEEQGGG